MICFALIMTLFTIRSFNAFDNENFYHLKTVLIPFIVFLTNFAFLPKLIKLKFVPDEIRLSPILPVYTAFSNQNFWTFALESYFTNLTIICVYICSAALR